MIFERIFGEGSDEMLMLRFIFKCKVYIVYFTT
jgi:hypothetical protein